ncbi:hypothetical protein BGZ67_002024 [Mortierella alpina]|nr:hypothetical protein BGZ67_002024 [Mortierella alpina]
MPHLSASRVLFEEGLYSDITVILQTPASAKKELHLHRHILAKESELFAALFAGTRNMSDKAITLLDANDDQGSQVMEIQCVDSQELHAFESSLRLLYTGSWFSERDFQTNSLDTRLRRGLDIMSQAGRLSLRGTTTALLQEEITQMCRNQPELLEKVSKSLRPEDRDDDQAVLTFDRDALQQMCRVAVLKVEIRDHCEIAIARNLYGSKKFRELRMSDVQISELRPGYIFPGGQESIYLLKGAPSLPLHPCRATNVEALRHVVHYYTAHNSQQALRTREFYVIPNEDDDLVDDEDMQKSTATLHTPTFYRVAFSTGFQWLMEQVIKVRGPFELIILLLKDAIDENSDLVNTVAFGEFASTMNGDVYLKGVSYITEGLLQAFQDPTLETFRNPGASGSLLNMISYGISSLTDLPPLRPRPHQGTTNGADAAQHHQDYPALSTLVMDFLWQVLELAIKRPHHLDFVQLLLDSITKVAPLSPFEVVDRIEERLAELLEETRIKIIEQRGDLQDKDDCGEQEVQEQQEQQEEDCTQQENLPSILAVKGQVTEDPRISNDNSEGDSGVALGRFSEGHRSEVSSGHWDDPDERRSTLSSVLLVPGRASSALIVGTSADDVSSVLEAEAEAEADHETPWMRPEYLQPLCLKLLTSFPMNIQSSLLWSIHDLQLL